MDERYKNIMILFIITALICIFATTDAHSEDVSLDKEYTVYIPTIAMGFQNIVDQKKEAKIKAKKEVEIKAKIKAKKEAKAKAKAKAKEKTEAEAKAKVEVKEEKENNSASNNSDYRVLRITEYCAACNTPRNSTTTASGRFVPNYTVASSDYPLGTILYVEGIGERRVDDTGCASGTLDLLTNTGSDGSCQCDLCTTRKVWVVK